MNYCEICGITLEMDFNDEQGMVCAQCKLETCNHSHIVDWNEDNNEVLHAVCTMESDVWPKCGECEFYVNMND